MRSKFEENFDKYRQFGIEALAFAGLKESADWRECGMRSPDLPKIVIAAGLVACIACAIYDWLHRSKGKSAT